MNRKILILRIFLRKTTILGKNSKNKTNSKNRNLCEYMPRHYSSCLKVIGHLEYHSVTLKKESETGEAITTAITPHVYI